jgi:hypothetical protein
MQQPAVSNRQPEKYSRLFRNMLMSRGGTPQPWRTKPFRTMARRHFLHWFEGRRATTKYEQPIEEGVAMG